MKLRSLVLLTAFLAAGLTACGGDQLTEFTFEEDITAIDISIESGNIVIDGDGPESFAKVDATASFSGDAPQIDVAFEGGVLTITHTCSGSADCSVDYAVTLPEPTSTVSAVTVDGSVTVVDIEGDVAIATEDGDVSINGLTGTIAVEVGTGSILGARLVSNDGLFRSADGNVDVTFDEPIASLTLASEKGNATAQVPGGPYKVESTAGGSTDIQIETSDAAEATITISAGDKVRIYAK